MLKIRETIIGIAGLALIAGCGTGEYKSRLQATLVRAGQTAKFDLHLHATTTDFSASGREKPGVSVRLPKLFDGSANNAIGQLKLLALPGFWYSMEKLHRDASGKNLAVYVGFGWVPKADKKEADLQAELLAQLKASLPNAAWQDVKAETPQGGTVDLKMLSGTGPQDFNTGAEDKPVEKVEGQYRLYLVPGSNDHVLIAWRGPVAAADFWQSVDVAMGTVKIESLPPPAKDAAAAQPAA